MIKSNNFSSQESYEAPVCETIDMMVEVNVMSPATEPIEDDDDDISM